MEGVIIAVISAVGSAGFFAFLQFLISRRDANNDEQEANKKTLNKLEKDSVRTQMLVMMAMYPDDKDQILILAEYYFQKLKGDWYMTDLFNRWLKDNGIMIPGWFILNKGGEA